MASASALPIGLSDVIQLLDGFVERIEHHEDLEFRYITWLTSIVGALIAAAATLLSRPPIITPSSSRFFVAGLCGIGAVVSVVAIAIHRGLMNYVDNLIISKEIN